MNRSETAESCWVISDGAAGNERQALALAQALGLTPRVLRIGFAQPWDWLAPRLTAGALRAVHALDGSPIAPPWPDIAIGCGRKAALLTRCLKDRSSGRCFTVQILDPRVDPALFDAVVAPRHDHLTGSHVIETFGALNDIDDAWLARARAQFADLEELAEPHTVVLIGASTRAQKLDAAYFDALNEQLAAWHARDGGSFLVSASRRTPADLVTRLREKFACLPGRFWADARDGENPYAGFLAWADRIVVTADSVNMLSEACATGKPVHAFSTQPIVGKLADFHHALAASGHLFAIEAKPPFEPVPPLRETSTVTAQIRARWQAAKDGKR
jgi:mitochondrial fission protein ELM1